MFGEGSPTKIDYRKKDTLVLTSLLEDLVEDFNRSLVVVEANFETTPHAANEQSQPATQSRLKQGSALVPFHA